MSRNSEPVGNAAPAPSTGCGNTHPLPCAPDPHPRSVRDRGGSKRQASAGGLMETHRDPDKAPSDGPNMVPFKAMPALLRRLMAFDELAKQGGA